MTDEKLVPQEPKEEEEEGTEAKPLPEDTVVPANDPVPETETESEPEH
jgi:hypothetical protein